MCQVRSRDRLPRRAVLSDEAAVVPKGRDGEVEALRVLTVARRSAVKARTQAGNQLGGSFVTAPAALRAALAHGTLAALAARCGVWERQCSRWHPGPADLNQFGAVPRRNVTLAVPAQRSCIAAGTDPG